MCYWHSHICLAQFYIHLGDIIYTFLFALEWQFRIIVQSQQYVLHCTCLIPLLLSESKESNTNTSDGIVYVTDYFQLLIPYFQRAGLRKIVEKRRTRTKKRDNNEIHSLKRKYVTFYVKQQSLLVKTGH